MATSLWPSWAFKRWVYLCELIRHLGPALSLEAKALDSISTQWVCRCLSGAALQNKDLRDLLATGYFYRRIHNCQVLGLLMATCVIFSLSTGRPSWTISLSSIGIHLPQDESTWLFGSHRFLFIQALWSSGSLCFSNSVMYSVHPWSAHRHSSNKINT